MHARHRSPGNGYRSNSFGMGGVTAASRISSEGSVRGHGMYNSEYRSYNRGFGRGQPKPFQQPQNPPQRGDIFVEAGRLATEYLVSKGLLPPNVLPGKWQNGSLKNQAGDFQGFRPQEGENQLPPEGRTSVLARLGNVVPNAGSGRRRFPDDYNSPGSRNYMRGKRRMGSFKNYGSDWSQEIGRSGSWSDKARASPDMEGDDDSFSVYQEERQYGKDAGTVVQKSRSSELAPQSDGAGDLESASEKYCVPDDVASKASSSSTGKDIPPENDIELAKRPDDLEIMDAGTGEVKDDTCNDESKQHGATENLPVQHCTAEGDQGSKNGNNLLSLCRFAKVPTKTRSSLALKGLKVDSVPSTEKDSDIKLPGGSGIPIEDVSIDGSSGDVQSKKIISPNCLDSDMLKAVSFTSMEDAGELGSAYTIEQGRCTRSRSFPERPFMVEQETSEGLPGFGRSSSVVMERGEKRAGQHSDGREGTKKPREWVPSKVTQTDENSHLSNLREKQATSEQGRTSPHEKVILAADQERSMDISLFPACGAEPCIEFAEEKQLFPGSFKICDLNLMETSDMNENHDADPLLIFPSIPEIKKEAAPVDIDLSISNSNSSDKYGRRGAAGKEVEVIDLENDSVHEHKASNNSERKAEPVFTDLESFPNHTQNTSDIADAQDGYGLMISELLGTDISNCPSVPPDINSLHNEMALHNGEGILGDDESIYMSLGEIPISMPEI
ncbi:uncharacterized protein At4g26450 isoform X2 [Cornus florida]|uniref:uncharacterized protein At4g26450 isoform X2 n=1 Tax=Cornus florida TaxID=4283 RepID=UPI00289FF936|nr:uncharacterized protein At4g26450 isoform X2 [Cornus florida]